MLKKIISCYRNKELTDALVYSSLFQKLKSYPDLLLDARWGGIGDALMYATVAHELKKTFSGTIEITSHYPEFFIGNRDVDLATYPSWRRMKRIAERLPKERILDPVYWNGTDQPNKHILKMLCEQVGITSDIDIRTYIYLTQKEISSVPEAYRNCIIVQSQGKPTWGINKNWYPDRFQKVVDHFLPSNDIIQIGAPQDYQLEGCIDLRGKLPFRMAASVLRWSSCFIGQVGALMHLARAVDTRSVIIYGGFEAPWQSGYAGNINITSELDCAPCWKQAECNPRHCMDNITVEEVIAAVKSVISTSI